MKHMDKSTFDRWEEDRRKRQAEREARRAERRRERAQNEECADERKEKVLHTRVSEPLDDAIRRAAEELRVPVSNLVRNVLEDVFDVVEKVTGNVGDLIDDLGDGGYGRVRRNRARHLARRFRREFGVARAEDDEEEEREVRAAPEPPKPPRQEFPDVVGWQPLILNGPQPCADCAREVAKGERAFVGLSASGLSGRWLCPSCMQARR
jgi:hypothetical protein